MINETGQNTQGVSKELVKNINAQLQEAKTLSNEATAKWESYKQEKSVESQEETTDNQSNVREFIFLAIALSALSFSAIFTRLSQDYISVNATVLNRFIFSALALFLWHAIAQSRRSSEEVKPSNEENQLRDFLLLISLGITAVLCTALWGWSLNQTSVANSNLLHNATPLFTVLGAWLFLKERFSRQYLIGLAIAIGGTLLIGLQDFNVSLNSLIGDLAALLSAAFYAGQYLLMEQLGKKFNTPTILLALTGTGAILLLPIVLIAGEDIFPSSLMGWVWVACLVLISELLGQGLLAQSLKSFSSTFIAIVMLLEPFFTAIFAYFIFSEQLSLINWIGFFLVLAGIYVVKFADRTAKV